jgi:hypothetical protein
VSPIQVNSVGRDNLAFIYSGRCRKSHITQSNKNGHGGLRTVEQFVRLTLKCE